MSYREEFKVVNLILKSDFETRGVDAFSLSILKMERQIRRIFTHICFQCPTFSTGDIEDLITALSENKNIYFNHFEIGINEIFPTSINNIFGPDYKEHRKQIDHSQTIRNKIFHGQLTGNKLSRPDMYDEVEKINFWCLRLAEFFENEISYDGFGDSFHKSPKPEAFKNIEWPFNDIDQYKEFLKTLYSKNNL